jgi:hypothetical protein
MHVIRLGAVVVVKAPPLQTTAGFCLIFFVGGGLQMTKASPADAMFAMSTPEFDGYVPPYMTVGPDKGSGGVRRSLRNGFLSHSIIV